MAVSRIEETLALHIRASGLPVPAREFRFAPDRRWRFDFAWPEIKLAVEVEGGIWTNGRHNRGKGMEADMTKYNRATVLGWRVLRVSGGMVTSGEAIRMIEGAM
jgi:very-short-patch-repair endonuclease